MYRAEQFLAGYLRADAKIRRIDKEIEDLNDSIDALRGQGDGQPRSTIIRSKTEEMATRLADKRAELIEAKLQAVDERAKVFDMIQRIEGIVEADVLYHLYIQGLKWDEIADLVHYSRYWTQVIWRRGLSIVEQMLE